MFKNTNSNKRYYTMDYYYKTKYNSKVFKVSLNQGCTCPNIDGTKAYGGCIYCFNKSGDFGGNKLLPLKKQFEQVKAVLLKKWPNAKYIAYFQAGTNTYGNIENLKQNFEEVLTYDNVCGINIATRCDAINDKCFKYLENLNKRCDLTIELGLQTVIKKTSNLINRGHTLKEFTDMVKKLKKANIKIVVHIINGLPYETKQDMLKTIKYVNKLKIFGVKIHMLNVIKGTKLEKLYNNKKFHILTREEYVDIVCDQLELLDENIVINRIVADSDEEKLIEPKWVIKKLCVLNEIDKELKKRNSWQGKKA